MLKRMDITPYRVRGRGISAPVTLALVTDLHNCDATPVLRAIDTVKPDAVVIAGDMMSKMTTEYHCGEALRFLREAAAEFPVFYGLGNHERLLGESEFARIRATGATLLVNSFAHFGEICIGARIPEHWEEPDDLAFLERFCKEDGYRVLLSHCPELYKQYLHKFDIPLILSGHAHGGQIRLFGHPVFSPGQGLFPRYAQGMHDGRLIVSRGLGNHTIVPRFFNRAELCIITIEGE